MKKFLQRLTVFVVIYAAGHGMIILGAWFAYQGYQAQTWLVTPLVIMPLAAGLFAKIKASDYLEAA